MSSMLFGSPFSQCISIFLDIVENVQEKQEIYQQQQCHPIYENGNESNSSITDSLILEEESFQNSNGLDHSLVELCCNEKLQQNQNIIKNVLKGFQKCIINTKDKDTQRLYINIYNPNKSISYSDIKKSLSKRIKDKKTRWNMKLKSILLSERLGPVFYNFLICEADEWLSHSKVMNLSQHQKLIDMLINTIQTGNSHNIKTYKKK